MGIFVVMVLLGGSFLIVFAGVEPERTVCSDLTTGTVGFIQKDLQCKPTVTFNLALIQDQYHLYISY